MSFIVSLLVTTFRLYTSRIQTNRHIQDLGLPSRTRMDIYFCSESYLVNSHGYIIHKLNHKKGDRSNYEISMLQCNIKRH